MLLTQLFIKETDHMLIQDKEEWREVGDKGSNGRHRRQRERGGHVVCNI